MNKTFTKRLQLSAKNNRIKDLPFGLSFLTGMLLGALVFLFIYGPYILNPLYDDWLLTEWYDLSQHYAGWQLYRASDWNFPIGLCSNSFYPYKISVIYTDSLPLVSLIFKLLSPLLPETFQFFGLYGMLTYMLQGGFAKLLLKKAMEKEWQQDIGALFFLTNCALLQRMYVHTALGSHYLILAALVLVVYSKELGTFRRRLALWTILGVVCVSIHFTLYGIVSVILLGVAIEEGLSSTANRSKAIINSITLLGVYILASFLVFYIFGGLYGNISGGSDGLGDYSANLNSLINPLDTSKLINELPHFDMQYEGLSYIGIGTILLGIIGLPNLIKRRSYFWSNYKNKIIAYSIVFILLWFIALSPTVTLGEIVLLEEVWPQWILDAWSLFRSSGRFLWPIMYAAIPLAMYFAKQETKRFFPYFLVIAAVLQLYEPGDIIEERQYTYNYPKEAHFSADELEDYNLSGKKHIQYMHAYYFGEYYGNEIRDQMIGYTEYALRHNMTLSNFHFSRDDMDKLEEQIDISMEALENGTPDAETLYVFRKQDFYEQDIALRIHNVNYIETENEMIAFAQ